MAERRVQAIKVHVSNVGFSGLFSGFGDGASLNEVRARVV
jgi:hypothetical protein